jgi:hypothetical protein
MQEHQLVGSVLVAGLVVFLVGAGGWKLVYDQPLQQALPAIHRDRRRRAWIHLWMIPAMFLTSAGLLGLAVAVGEGIAVVLRWPPWSTPSGRCAGSCRWRFD